MKKLKLIITIIKIILFADVTKVLDWKVLDIKNEPDFLRLEISYRYCLKRFLKMLLFIVLVIIVYLIIK